MITLALCAAAMWIGWQIIQREREPGYQCPQCGTRRQDEHGEDCSWR